jgi:hypothetical protein
MMFACLFVYDVCSQKRTRLSNQSMWVMCASTLHMHAKHDHTNGYKQPTELKVHTRMLVDFREVMHSCRGATHKSALAAR